ITELPTYYLTRVERGLLEYHSAEIAELLRGQIAELGSGSAKKTQLLLESCVRLRQTTYLPIDVDREVLRASGSVLCSELDGLKVTGLWGRYEAGLEWLRAHSGGRSRSFSSAAASAMPCTRNVTRCSTRSPALWDRVGVSWSPPIWTRTVRFWRPVTTIPRATRPSPTFGST